MRHIRTMGPGLLVMLALLAFAPVEFMAGCKGAPPSAIAGKTLDTVGASVDAAMKTAAALRASGKISSMQWQNVAAAHDRYRSAYNAAVDAAAVAVDKASVPANVAALAADVTSLVATFTK